MMVKNMNYKVGKNICILTMIVVMICSNINIYATSMNVNNLEKKENTSQQITEIVKATDIDLGDYVDTMAVGDKQLLTVTILPLNATEKEITYVSSNTTVATVNALGRITALSQGNTTISVKVGSVSKSFELNVKEKESDIVNVTDIEISGYQEELEVGKSINLSSTVIPSNATQSTVLYKSSDTNIATVSSNGEVRGISKGKVIITVSAGNFSKNISINVKVGTTGITMNKSYLVLKIGESYTLKASATPTDANQNMTYKSANEGVATVSANGVVNAKSSGSTAIIVSNGDYTTSVSVIVNKSFNQEINVSSDIETNENQNIVYDEIINVLEQNIISKEILKDIYDKNKVIQIVADEYKIVIDGKDIVNYNNEFYTDIMLQSKNNGIEFNINDGKDLCGNITLHLENNKYKYLYLYNVSKDKYEQIQISNNEEIKLSSAGKYIMTNSKIGISMDTILMFIIIGIILIIIGSAVYIFVKKRYLFW